jgi:hypothetical protein
MLQQHSVSFGRITRSVLFARGSGMPSQYIGDGRVRRILDVLCQATSSYPGCLRQFFVLEGTERIDNLESSDTLSV